MDAAPKDNRRVSFSKIAGALKEAMQRNMVWRFPQAEHVNVDVMDGELSLPDRYVVFMSSWDRRRGGEKEAALLDELAYELLEVGDELGGRTDQFQLKIEIRTDEALPQGELRVECVPQPLGRERKRRRGDQRVPLLRDKTEDPDIRVQPGKDTGRKRILIVDDSESMLHMLSRALKVLNHDCAEAKDGVEAVTVLNKECFDLVIADIRMPKMSGLKLLRIIREQIPRLPVILITGYRPARAQEDELKMRADGYLPKPFTLVELKRELEGVLRGNAKCEV